MRTTKQQLQQQVEQLRAECDRLRAENAALRSRHTASNAPRKPHGALTIVIDGLECVTYLTKQAGIEAMQRIKAALPTAKVFAR